MLCQCYFIYLPLVRGWLRRRKLVCYKCLSISGYKNEGLERLFFEQGLFCKRVRIQELGAYDLLITEEKEEGKNKVHTPPVRDPNSPVTPAPTPRPATAADALFIKPLKPDPLPPLGGWAG